MVGLEVGGGGGRTPEKDGDGSGGLRVWGRE